MAKSDVPANVPQNPETPLYKAVSDEFRRAGMNQGELAARARVSTKAINEVLNRSFALKPLPAEAEMKRLVGYAETLTRLAIAFGLSPEQVLASYGMPSGVPAVEAAVLRASRESSRPHILLDPALDIIRSRFATDAAGPHITMLAWPPFFYEKDEGSPLQSVAARYIEHLVGAIHPEWASGLQLHGKRTVSECMDMLLTPKTTERTDAVFGIYDTAYRRALGLDFVAPVRFLRFPLGGIASAEGWGWRRLGQVRPEARPVAIVLGEEIGRFHLAAYFGYADRNLRRVESAEPPDVAAAFRAEVEFQQSEPLARRRDVILVADMQICVQVRRHLNENAYPFSLDDPRTPSYVASMAVRHDCPEWGSLLTRAHAELYDNAPDAVARLYAEVFLDNPATLLWVWDTSYRVPEEEFRRVILDEMEIILESRGHDPSDAAKACPASWRPTQPKRRQRRRTR